MNIPPVEKFYNLTEQERTKLAFEYALTCCEVALKLRPANVIIDSPQIEYEAMAEWLIEKIQSF